MRSILVTGVQAVGKTTVTRLAATTTGLDCWDYADLMLRADPTLPGKDAIADLTWDHRQRVYARVDTLLRALFNPGDGTDTLVLLENHLSVIDAGTVRTFPHDKITLYNPVGIAVIHADPHTIARRRLADQERRRRPGAPTEITDQQAVNLAEAQAISVRTGMPYLVLHNHDRTSAARVLAHWAQGLLP